MGREERGTARDVMSEQIEKKDCLKEVGGELGSKGGKEKKNTAVERGDRF